MNEKKKARLKGLIGGALTSGLLGVAAFKLLKSNYINRLVSKNIKGFKSHNKIVKDILNNYGIRDSFVVLDRFNPINRAEVPMLRTAGSDFFSDIKAQRAIVNSLGLAGAKEALSNFGKYKGRDMLFGISDSVPATAHEAGHGVVSGLLGSGALRGLNLTLSNHTVPAIGSFLALRSAAASNDGVGDAGKIMALSSAPRILNEAAASLIGSHYIAKKRGLRAGLAAAAELAPAFMTYMAVPIGGYLGAKYGPKWISRKKIKEEAKKNTIKARSMLRKSIGV